MTTLLPSYKPSTRDAAGGQIYLQTITAMDFYSSISLEECRYQFYLDHFPHLFESKPTEDDDFIATKPIVWASPGEIILEATCTPSACRLFNVKEYSDVVFRFVRGKVLTPDAPLYLHKFIICSNSTMYKVMLSSIGMIESKTNEVLIDADEDDPYLFTMMMRSVYDPKYMNNLTPYQIIQILIMFDKYGFEKPKAIVVQSLLDHLNRESAREVLLNFVQVSESLPSVFYKVLTMGQTDQSLRGIILDMPTEYYLDYLLNTTIFHVDYNFLGTWLNCHCKSLQEHHMESLKQAMSRFHVTYFQLLQCIQQYVRDTNFAHTLQQMTKDHPSTTQENPFVNNL